MNPVSKSPLPVVLDPVAAVIIAQLKQEMKREMDQLKRRMDEMKLQDFGNPI